MPLITRRRAKRREVQIHRARSFPFALNITKLASGEWHVASMPAPEYSDTTIRCRTCGEDFECNAADQRRRYAVNHHNPYFLPPYCPECS